MRHFLPFKGPPPPTSVLPLRGRKKSAVLSFPFKGKVGMGMGLDGMGMGLDGMGMGLDGMGMGQ